MTPLQPKFTITNRMPAAIILIERARGFVEAARLSDDWVRDMGNQALIKEAHYTTHIEGARLTLDQAKRLWSGENVPEADPDDARELLNYRSAFEFVSAFYKSIQRVRDNGMNLTVWLDYFVAGLETQMIEVKQRGEQVIRRDVLVQKHGLNKRQGKALDLLM